MGEARRKGTRFERLARAVVRRNDAADEAARQRELAAPATRLVLEPHEVPARSHRAALAAAVLIAAAGGGRRR